MSSNGRPSFSTQARPSSTPSQRRREPPRPTQGSSAVSWHVPTKNNSKPSETKYIVLSDTDDDSPGEEAGKLVIEIDDDSGDEQAASQPGDQTRRNFLASLPPKARLSSTQAAAPSLPPQPGRLPVSARRSLPPANQNGKSAQHERPNAPPTRQPPGFWDTKRPQPEAPRTAQPLQPQKQPQYPAYTKASRKQAYIPLGPQIQKPPPQQSQPQLSHGPSARSSANVTTKSPTTATTSTFSTSFKHYAFLRSPDGRPATAPNKDLSRHALPPNQTPALAQGVPCGICTQDNIQCDGLRPACFACHNRGLTCVYAVEGTLLEKPTSLETLTVPSSIQVATELSSGLRPKNDSASAGGLPNQSARREEAKINAPDSAPARKTKITLRAPHPQVSVPKELVSVTDHDTHKFGLLKSQIHESAGTESSASLDDEQLDHASVLSGGSFDLKAPFEIESTLDAFTKLMEGLRSDLHGWREISTQAELRQATMNARSRPGPKIDQNLPDPFKAITEKRRSAKDGLQERQQSKKSLVIRTTPSSFPTGGVLLPKYQAIGRVSSSVLAPNYKTAKHWAYSAEDENDPDLNRKYKDFQSHYAIDFDSLNAQRQCQELVWLWRPWVEEAFARLRIRHTDILYFFTFHQFEPERRIEHGSEQWGTCRTCGLADTKSRSDNFNDESFKALPRPNDQSLAYAAFLARAFHDMSGVSLWHIAEGGMLQPHYWEERETTAQQSNLCLICFRHRCPDHGSYKDPEADTDAGEGSVFVNDSEQDFNVRRYVSLPDVHPQADDKTHLCGVFCVQPPPSLHRMLGRQIDGAIDGDIRQAKEQVRRILSDNQLCSRSCFWDAPNRRDIKASEVKFQPFLSASQKALVEKLIPFYLHNPRGPCLISRIIRDVDCLMVFNHMIFTIYNPSHPQDLPGAISGTTAGQPGSNQTGKKRRVITVMDTTKSADLVNRPVFHPCSHEGPCHSSSTCNCAKDKVHCQQFCGCDKSCSRRFRGCTCKTGGRKMCFEDSRCECWMHSRECDPHLCGSCGVVDVLDSSNKYKDEIRTGRCRNNRIQLGILAPTTKAPSQVQGYGLYSRSEILMHDFIGEYTGEIVSRSEGNRRGTIYHLINQEYLFNLNLDQEIDASKNGNKMRFMNNSQREEYINVEAKSLFCGGVVRIGLFAKRDIKAGAELLWKYGYSAELVKFFWEPGEKPATARALIPYSNERLSRSTGKNKLAGETPRKPRERGSPSMAVSRKKRRKRPLVESPAHERNNGADDSSGEEVLEGTVADLPKLSEIDDSADSDYETKDPVSEDAETEDDDVDEDSDLDPVHEARGRTAGSRTPKRGQGNLAQVTPSSSRSVGGSTTRHRNHTADTGVKKNSRQIIDHRRRQINPGDKRLGGRAQQRAWETRKHNSLGAQMATSPE